MRFVMSAQKKIACIVLAAGMSTRFGGVKQLARVGGESLIQKALDSANRSKADYVYLVVGHDASEIAGKVEIGRAEIVLNKDFRKGLSSSLKASISNLPEDCVGTLFMVADQPFLHSKQLDQMIGTFVRHKDRIIALAFEGEPRNPVIIPRALFPEILNLKGDTGAIEIVRSHNQILTLIEMKNEKIFFDVDTRSDLEELLSMKA